MTAAEALAIVKVNCNTTGDPVVSDADVSTVIAQYKTVDADGYMITDTANYTETYHIPMICRDVWMIKAGRVATAYDMENGDQTLSRDQMRNGCLQMANEWGKKCFGSAPMPTRYDPLKEYPLGDSTNFGDY